MSAQENLNEEQFASYQGMDPKVQKRVDKLAGVHISTGKSPEEAWGIALGVGEKINNNKAIRKSQRDEYKREVYRNQTKKP